MAIFPSIRPTVRLYIPGDAPSTFATGLSGRTTGFRRGNRRVGQSLALSFDHLTEAAMQQIKDHYIGQQGTFDIFFLSADIWADHAAPPVPLISDYAWRYESPPAITDTAFDRFNVQVALTTEPIDIGDLILNGGLAGAAPARDYIVNGGLAAATPARDYIITPGGAA